MSKIRRTNQGGSIVLFIIVVILLIIGLIGGIYLLSKRGEQVRRDQAIAIVDQQIADQNAKNIQESVPQPESDNSNVAAPVAILGDNQTSEALPVTGPGSAIIELAGVGLLTTFAVGYAKSRRTVRSL